MAGLAVLLLAGSAVVYLLQNRPDVEAEAAAPDLTTTADRCGTTTELAVAVTAEILPAMKSIADGIPLTWATGCVRLRAIDSNPTGVLQAMVGGATTAPDVWIPDSSVWLTQALAGGAAVEAAGSVGQSPVVIATSTAAADSAGWTTSPPSWAQALTSQRSLAVPDPREHAPSLLALAAARSEASADPAAVREITVATALNQQRGRVISPKQGLAAIEPSDPDAPLVISGEADLRRSLGGDGGGLVEVIPAGPAPMLDYPIIVSQRERATDVQAGLDAFVNALTSDAGRTAAMELGLKPPRAQTDEVALPLEVLTALTTELAILSRPSQILVVVDISTSMLADAGGGLSRADIASQALAGALPLLPDSTRVGMWVFASELEGTQDYRVVSPLQRLDSPAADTTQRELLQGSISQLSGILQPGGTSLYDVTLAAMQSAQQSWDPEVVTTVAVITDGKNEDSAGLTLEQLEAELQAGADPERPLGLIAVAFGPDADLDSLTRITDAAAGWGPSEAVDAREPSALAGLVLASLGARIDAAADAAEATPTP